MLLLSLCLPLFVLGIEPWYANLQHFGPTTTEGWSARPMTLVSEFCQQISVEVNGGDEFLFVSSVPPPIPPLGPLNWKQGKIGCGQVVDDSIDKVFVFAALPGGQSGRYTGSGPVTITVCTAEVMRITLNFTAVPWSRTPTILPAGKSVIAPGTSQVGVIVVADKFDESLVSVVGGKVLDVQQSGPDHLVTVIPTDKEIVVSYGVASYKLFVSDLLLDGQWTAPVSLVDQSGTFEPENQPANGWTVTPIHANVLSGNRVLISGWFSFFFFFYAIFFF